MKFSNQITHLSFAKLFITTCSISDFETLPNTTSTEKPVKFIFCVLGGLKNIVAHPSFVQIILGSFSHKIFCCCISKSSHKQLSGIPVFGSKTFFEDQQNVGPNKIWVQLSFSSKSFLFKNEDSVKQAPAYCRSFLDGLYK